MADKTPVPESEIYPPSSKKSDEIHESYEERLKTAGQKGTITGKPAGDIMRHAPVGPIVGEVFKPREALNTINRPPWPVKSAQDEKKET